MQLSKPIRIMGLAVLFLMLSGCWSSTTIQDQHYVATMGLDFDGETYTLYAQILDFRSVAKLEGQSSNGKENTYIGKGSGGSVNTAAADLYTSAQVRIDWGQTKAVVVTKRAMELLDSQIVERVYRFPENRYNTWLYVTEEPMEEILSTSSFYNRTAMYSILHMPKNSHEQYSTLPPIQMFQYMSSISETDRITFVPMLGYDTEHWKSNVGGMKLLKVTGAFFETHNEIQKSFTIDELQGYRWLDPHMTRTMILVQDDQTTYAALTFFENKFKIIPKVVDGEVIFTIKAKYKGGMYEYLEEIEYNKMIELAKEKIKKEILATYRMGVEEEVDIYNFMHHFRIKMPRAWKTMTKDGSQFILNERSIGDIIIECNIVHNGKYKRMR